MKLTKIDKKQMIRNLSDLRKEMLDTTAGRLKVYPFGPMYARILFGMPPEIHNSPCDMFGKQIVHKIVDELLDD